MRHVGAMLLCDLVLLAAFAGCPPVPHAGNRKATMPDALALTAADEGKTRDAHVGQHATLQLEETPGTGYLWVLQATPQGAIEETGKEWVAPGTEGAPSGTEGKTPATGGAGMRRFHLKILTPGVVRLEAKLRRSWEAEGSALARYNVTLQVRNQ